MLWHSVTFGLLCLSTGLQLTQAATYAGVKSLYQGNSGYDTERLAYNRRFDLYPYVITYPSTSSEVAAIVKQGASENRQIVARSGRHSYIANGLGGKNGAVVVDMKNFTAIAVDSTSFNAVIGTGNKLGNVATALNKKGRAIPHGTCAYVGIGGHASFGGFGFTSRMWGLTLDNILAAEIVLANGTVTTASATKNQDLFWAIRGSAPSFGIVTSWTMKTYAQPAHGYTFSYQYQLSASQAANGLMAFQNLSTNHADLPAHLGMELTLGQGWSKGQVYFELIGQWFADSSGLNATLKPLLDTLPKPTSQYLKGGTFFEAITEIAGSLDTSKPDETDTFYAKSLMTPKSSLLTYNAASAFMTYLANDGFDTSLNWFMQIELYGGPNSAIAAVAADATSYARRDALFTMQLYASSSTYNPPFPSSGFTFVNNIFNTFVNNQPSGWNYGMYTNYVEDKLSNWQTPYYGTHYSRLQSIKKAVDPKNVFNFFTSIGEP